MCYLITATLPPGADAGAVRALAKRFGCGWELFSTRHIARQLSPGKEDPLYESSRELWQYKARSRHA